MIMFRNDPRDLAATLSEMEYRARQLTNFNQIEAKEKIKEWIQNDRRFDSYDPQRLTERVQLSKNNGAVLELDDPQLQRGGQPRPLDRWR
jgi:hypothetical protein